MILLISIKETHFVLFARIYNPIRVPFQKVFRCRAIWRAYTCPRNKLKPKIKLVSAIYLLFASILIISNFIYLIPRPLFHQEPFFQISAQSLPNRRPRVFEATPEDDVQFLRRFNLGPVPKSANNKKRKSAVFESKRNKNGRGASKKSSNGTTFPVHTLDPSANKHYYSFLLFNYLFVPGVIHIIDYVLISDAQHCHLQVRVQLT